MQAQNAPLRRLVELTPDECWQLAGSCPVGRLAWTTTHGPMVIPVNFTVDGDTVHIRTAAYSQAARSFRTYLKERPGGPMTREALGRLMEASQKEGDTASARAAAERYLRDYPSGPHAKLASRLVTAP